MVLFGGVEPIIEAMLGMALSNVHIDIDEKGVVTCTFHDRAGKGKVISFVSENFEPEIDSTAPEQPEKEKETTTEKEKKPDTLSD